MRTVTDMLRFVAVFASLVLAVSAQIRVAPLEKNNCVDRVTTVEYGKHYPDGSSGRITIIVFQKGGETTFKMDRDGKLLLHPLFPDGVVYPARASCDTITFLTNGEDTAQNAFFCCTEGQRAAGTNRAEAVDKIIRPYDQHEMADSTLHIVTFGGPHSHALPISPNCAALMTRTTGRQAMWWPIPANVSIAPWASCRPANSPGGRNCADALCPASAATEPSVRWPILERYSDIRVDAKRAQSRRCNALEQSPIRLGPIAEELG